MNPRIAIASGGTGGHFYPTLAIARELSRRGADPAILVAGRHASEQLQLAAREGFPAQILPAFQLPSGVGSGLAFPFRTAGAVCKARRLLRELSPGLLLGMGSFAAVPACAAAVWARVPLVLHEGNAWMGRANRWFSRWAVEAGLSLPLVEGCRVRCPTVRTGMPLREALVKAAAAPGWPDAYAAEAGLAPDRQTLLVFGGSQGARFINETLRAAVPLLGEGRRRLQVIHLTGSDENEPLQAAYRDAGVPACVRRSEANIQNAYLAAGLVVCRAGASSLCELALFGKAAILIPLPTAAEDHQSANARVAAALGGAVHLPQAEAAPERLAELVRRWLGGDSLFASLAAGIRQLAIPDGAARMADLCLRHCRKS